MAILAPAQDLPVSVSPHCWFSAVPVYFVMAISLQSPRGVSVSQLRRRELPASVERSPAQKYIPTPTARSEADIDRALVTRFQGGDGTAFNEIVTRHRVKIHAL